MQRFCVKDKTYRAAATQEQKMKKKWFRSTWCPRCSHGYPHPKPRFCCRRFPKPVFPHFSRVVVIHEPSRIRRKREAINTAWLSSDLFPPQTQGGIFPRNLQGSFCGRKLSQNYTTKSRLFVSACGLDGSATSRSVQTFHGLQSPHASRSCIRHPPQAAQRLLLRIIDLTRLAFVGADCSFFLDRDMTE